MKKYFTPIRSAAYLMVLYCLGHTLGALVSTPHFSEASNQVVAEMKSVRVPVQGFERRWWDFYLGFGYHVSIFFLLTAALAWFIGGLPAGLQRRCAPVSWALLLAYVGTTVLACSFFFVTPILFSIVITGLLAVHCLATAHGDEERELPSYASSPSRDPNIGVGVKGLPGSGR